jgi:hypothetical protein
MRASESTPKHGMCKKMAVLFLPKTLAARLTVLGFIFGGLTEAGPTAFGLRPANIPLILFVWAFVVVIRNCLKQKGHRVARLFQKLAVVVSVIIAYLLVVELGRFLAFMAAGGSSRLSFVSSGTSPGPLGIVETYLLLVTVVLLVWIPEVLFRIQLDMSGAEDAQRVLLGLITAASCAMTGVCFLLAHFGGGPLRNVNIGTLVVGTIATVLLVAQPYRSLARVCWQRGIADVFSLRARKQHWANMVTELGKALDRTDERDVTPSSAASPAVEKTA